MADSSLSGRLPRGSNKGQYAACHPDRKAVCKRLCQSCYVKSRLEQKERRAECHPDRPHVARGLCRHCYRAKARNSTPIERKQAVWRRASLKYNFGITTEQYDAMLTDQGGHCALCPTTDDGRRRLSVDHDHSTGKVRGLLCFRCNTRLGVYEKFGTDFAAYLEKHR
jgi:hypothetical protein